MIMHLYTDYADKLLTEIHFLNIIGFISSLRLNHSFHSGFLLF